MKNEHSAADIFNKMKSIVEQPGSPFLQSYKNDFYTHDHEVISKDLHPGRRFIWVLGPNGTHLTPIGIHPKQNEWALATIHNGLTATAAGVAIYLITTNGVTELTPARAKQEIQGLKFVVTNGVVRKLCGDLFATFNLRRFLKPGNGNQFAEARFDVPNFEHLTMSDILAIRDIATSEAILAWHSFFVQIDEITINDQRIHKLIEERTEACLA